MNYLKHKNYLLVILIASSLAACVTINIYFPAAAAEKAAEKIVDEVWQLKEDATKANASTPAAKPEGTK